MTTLLPAVQLRDQVPADSVNDLITAVSAGLDHLYQQVLEAEADAHHAEVRLAELHALPDGPGNRIDQLHGSIGELTRSGGDYFRKEVDAARARARRSPRRGPRPGRVAAIVDLALQHRPACAVVTAVLRAASPMPILVVAPAGVRSVDVLAAYDAGADQLVAETVGASELVARVRALLRRTPLVLAAEPGGAIELGSISIDPAAGALVVQGEKVRLTADELVVVEALARRPGSVVQRSALVALLPGRTTQAVDAIIRQLRTKIEAVEGRRRIETVRGVGFRLADDPEPVTWMREPA